MSLKAMCLLKNNAGFGLVGTLVNGALLLIVGAGAGRIAEVVIGNTLAQNTHFEEQELKKAVRVAVNEKCKDNLKPSNLQHTDGRLPTNIKTLTFLTPDQNNDFDDDPPKPVNFKPTGLIKIVKANLNNLTNNLKHRDFTLYYLKPRLGEQSTIQDHTDNDTEGCTATDQSGCYAIKCKIRYKCDSANKECDDDSNEPDFCYATNCGGTLQAENWCETGEYLKGFKDNGDPDCIAHCPIGEFFKGIKSNGDPDCGRECPAGQVSDADGNCFVVMRSRQVSQAQNPQGFTCSDGEVLQGLDSNGRPICISLCINGKTWDTNTKTCKCPVIKPRWDRYQCVACSGGTTWSTTTNTCSCPSGNWNGSNCVTCSGGKIWNSVSKACRCPSGQSWNNTSNLCEKYTLLNNLPLGDCPSGQVLQGANCVPSVQCSSPRVLSGSNCVCPSGNWNGLRCVTCSGGKTWNTDINNCKCPEGKTWASRSQSCEANCSELQIRQGMFFDPYEGCFCGVERKLKRRYDESDNDARYEGLKYRCMDDEEQRGD